MDKLAASLRMATKSVLVYMMLHGCSAQTSYEHFTKTHYDLRINDDLRKIMNLTGSKT